MGLIENVPYDIRCSHSLGINSNNSSSQTKPLSNINNEGCDRGQHSSKSMLAVATRRKLNSFVILLYFSYTLNIYILWTNCVIFAVAVQTFDARRAMSTATAHRNRLYDLWPLPSSSVLAAEATKLTASVPSQSFMNEHNRRGGKKGGLASASVTRQYQLAEQQKHAINGDAKQQRLRRYSRPTRSPGNLSKVQRRAKRMPDNSDKWPVLNKPTIRSFFSISTNVSNGIHGQRKHDCKSCKRRKIYIDSPYKAWQAHGNEQWEQQHHHEPTQSSQTKKQPSQQEQQQHQRQLRHKRESTKNVIRNAIYRIIKRNVNNFTKNLLSNSTANNNALSRLVTVQREEQQQQQKQQQPQQQTPSLSAASSASPPINRTASTSPSRTLHGITMTEQATTTSVPATASSTIFDDTSWPRNISTATNSSHRHTTIITTLASTDISIASTLPPILRRISIRPESNHYKVNNEFENSFQSKHNKTGIGQLKIDVKKAPGEKGVVSLLGLFELTTRHGLRRPEGRSELAAAQMAVRHINERGLLPGYTLQLLWNDTKCDPGVGVDRFFHALYTQHLTRMLMLLGSACSEVTESLAKVVPYWNIVQVSFGSTSPALSDRREFPLFYRTVAPDSSHNPARIAFIRRFGWDTVTTFSQNEEIHSLAVNDLVTELESANISCAATITFGESDFKNQLKMLRDLDTRIIIGSFSHDLAPKIFCEAYKLGMYGADYAWILHEIVGPPWWKGGTHECNQKQLREASENLLVVSSHNSIVGGAISYSGLTNSMFVKELASLDVPQPLSRYAPQTYDAVWAIALALRGAEERWQNNSVAKLDSFDYTRYDMALEFLHQFSRLNFLGVSGPVSFSGADRIGTSAFNQVQNGMLRSVALFYPSRMHLDFHCPECVPIKWKSGQVPIAKRIFKLRVATIAPAAFYTITSIASVGITMSIGFLAFNLHFRKLKAIKLSSPKLSNITAVGCILVYAAVVLLGLDYSTLPANDKAFPAVCTARVYLLSSGFSLAFGSMFAKTYRVHRIFTHSGGGVCKDKMLRDTQLISLVCALLLLDGLVVTLWVVADPMERHLSNLTLEISSTDRSVVYQPQVEVCRSQHTQTWLGALYVYKGLLLVVGVYMAWETRHVQIAALNDSQYIGVSVYSVVITSAIVVVLANLIAERVTLAFITITALILTSTTATLCLLFLPKMNDIWGKGVITDPVIHSMGLKMECNTRRFVTDDKRELQYRVEVQNRVYKKEMAALDAEITKLEKMLENSSSTSSSNLSIPPMIRHELAVVNECDIGPMMGANSKQSKPRTPSIGGGLPLLLLSVLPPVIPRASWPSAEHMTMTMRKSVTFSSEPQLEDSSGSGIVRLPAIDLLNLRLTHQQATADARKGFLDRIIGMFGSRPPSRKASTTSIAGGSTGIAAALKAHMGLFSNLVPSTSTSSCNAINTTGMRPLRKSSMAKSGNAINSIASSIAEGMQYRGRVKHSYPAFIISDENNSNGNLAETGSVAAPAAAHTRNIYVEVDREQRVNFQLPDNRRPSVCFQMSQPTLRERVRGSPRFPHRIAPTSSLNALEDGQTASGSCLGSTEQQHLYELATKPKWKSMEDSTLASASSITLTNLKSALKQTTITTIANTDETAPSAPPLPASTTIDSTADVDEGVVVTIPSEPQPQPTELALPTTATTVTTVAVVNTIETESISHNEDHPVPPETSTALATTVSTIREADTAEPPTASTTAEVSRTSLLDDDL